MIKNYLLIAFRNFKRQKLFSLLNIFGLALGLSSAILIFLYVSDELRYDVMHPNYKKHLPYWQHIYKRRGPNF
jgi:putative ABC transport system permease protein